MTLATVAAGCSAALGALAGFEAAAAGGGAIRTRRHPPSHSRSRPASRGLRGLALLGRLRFAPAADLAGRIEAAGSPHGLRTPEWLGVKAAMAVTATLAAVLVAGGAPGRTGALLVLAAPVAGFMAPDLWLLRMARARVDQARRDLPDMLDLLRVTVEAGLPTLRAIGVVAAEFAGPLAREWRAIASVTTLGEPLDRALGPIERRLPCEEVRAFARALRESRRLGAPLGRVLASQAAAARHARSTRIREEAARAGPKIQLVVALVMVPSVLLMVGAALLTSVSATGLGLPA